MEIKKYQVMTHILTGFKITITDVFEDSHGDLQIEYRKENEVFLFNQDRQLSKEKILSFTKPYYVFIKFYKLLYV